MSITFVSKGKEIDVTYGGFYNYRMQLAKLVGEDFYAWYDELLSPYRKRTSTDEELEQKLLELQKKYKLSEGLIDFFLASDCGGKVDYKTAKEISNFVQPNKIKFPIGHTAHPDCPSFDTLSEMFYDAGCHRWVVKWY